MPIIRAKHDVVAISRALIEDDRLSWSARGIMAYIDAQPDDFVIDAAALASATRDAYKGCLSTAHQAAWRALDELIAAGYLRGDQA
jgi:hypothetical protein